MSSDLIQRLRARAREDRYWQRNVIEEAATLLEQQAAEIERLRSQEWIDEAMRLAFGYASSAAHEMAVICRGGPSDSSEVKRARAALLAHLTGVKTK